MKLIFKDATLILRSEFFCAHAEVMMAFASRAKLIPCSQPDLEPSMRKGPVARPGPGTATTS